MDINALKKDTEKKFDELNELIQKASQSVSVLPKNDKSKTSESDILVNLLKETKSLSQKLQESFRKTNEEKL